MCMKTGEYIIAAAVIVRTPDFLPPSVDNRNIRIGMTHSEMLRRIHNNEKRIYWQEDLLGFLTSELRFVNRWEAMVIAKAARQLYSEQYALFADNVDLKPYYEKFKEESPHKGGLLEQLEWMTDESS